MTTTAASRKLPLSLFAVLIVLGGAVYHAGCTSSTNAPNNQTPATTSCRDSCVMLKTSDGGHTWTPVYAHGALVLYKRLGDLAIGMGDSNSAFIRFATGDASVCYPSPTKLNLLDLEYEAGETWICSDYVYKSSDYGTHWFTAPLRMSQTGFRDLEFGQGGICLVCSDDTIYRSTDFGQSWTGRRVTAGFQDQVLDIQFINMFGYAYAITSLGGIFLTMDNGQTWTKNASSFPGMRSTYSDDLGGATYQVAVGDSGLILRSETGGATWEVVNHQGEDLLAVATNGVNWFAVGKDQIWTGSADARTWSVYTYPTPRWFHDITFFDQNNGVIVGM